MKMPSDPRKARPAMPAPPAKSARNPGPTRAERVPQDLGPPGPPTVTPSFGGSVKVAALKGIQGAKPKK